MIVKLVDWLAKKNGTASNGRQWENDIVCLIRFGLILFIFLVLAFKI